MHEDFYRLRESCPLDTFTVLPHFFPSPTLGGGAGGASSGSSGYVIRAVRNTPEDRLAVSTNSRRARSLPGPRAPRLGPGARDPLALRGVDLALTMHISQHVIYWLSQGGVKGVFCRGLSRSLSKVCRGHCRVTFCRGLTSCSCRAILSSTCHQYPSEYPVE